jgi:hypothetical protein
MTSSNDTVDTSLPTGVELSPEAKARIQVIAGEYGNLLADIDNRPLSDRMEDMALNADIIEHNGKVFVKLDKLKAEVEQIYENARKAQ